MYKALPGHVFPLTREGLKKYDDEIARFGEERFYKEEDRHWYLGKGWGKGHRGFAREFMNYVGEHKPRLSYTVSRDGKTKVFKIFECLQSN
jgi:hypothetical protein